MADFKSGKLNRPITMGEAGNVAESLPLKGRAEMHNFIVSCMYLIQNRNH